MEARIRESPSFITPLTARPRASLFPRLGHILRWVSGAARTDKACKRSFSVLHGDLR